MTMSTWLMNPGTKPLPGIYILDHLASPQPTASNSKSAPNTPHMPTPPHKLLLPSHAYSRVNSMTNHSVNPAHDARVFSLLEKIIAEQKEHRRLLNYIVQGLPRCNNNQSEKVLLSANEGHFPLKTVE